MFEAKTRLQKILVGQNIEPKTPDEAAVKAAVQNGTITELPAVTTADNGDVLAVVNGKWGKAKPTSGDVIFDGVFDPVNSTITIDYDDLANMVTERKAGKNVVLHFTVGEGVDTYVPMITAVQSANNYYFALFGSEGLTFDGNNRPASCVVVFANSSVGTFGQLVWDDTKPLDIKITSATVEGTTTYSADVSFADAWNAYKAGRIVRAVYYGPNENPLETLNLSTHGGDGISSGFLSFTTLRESGSVWCGVSITFSMSNGVESVSLASAQFSTT